MSIGQCSMERAGHLYPLRCMFACPTATRTSPHTQVSIHMKHYNFGKKHRGDPSFKTSSASNSKCEQFQQFLLHVAAPGRVGSDVGFHTSDPGTQGSTALCICKPLPHLCAATPLSHPTCNSPDPKQILSRCGDPVGVRPNF